MRPLAVVDQHEQDVAVGPLGDPAPARRLDALVGAAYGLDGGGRLGGVAEEHPSREPHRPEESPYGVVRQPPREEQPVHGLYGRELGGPGGEKQQDAVRAAPHAPRDGGGDRGMVQGPTSRVASRTMTDRAIRGDRKSTRLN